MRAATTQRSRLLMVMKQEMRLMRVDRSFWLVGLVFLALTAYALANGLSQTAHRDRGQAAVLQADRAQRDAQHALLVDILAGRSQPTPFANPADPARMASGYGGQHATLPSAPLAPVALGQSDLFPSQFRVTNESRVNFLNPSDIENPWHMLSGHFDLAFVIAYLLPLLIFAVSYDVLSAERESGTLRLLLSQPLQLRSLLTGKLLARALVILVPAVVIPLAVLGVARLSGLTHQGSGFAGAALWWALFVGAYATFWFAMVVAVNAFGASSGTNAMVLVITWVVFVLVIPVLLNLVVTQAAPMPSRTELAWRTRLLTAQAMQHHSQLLQTDYDHVGKGAVLLPRSDGKIDIAGRAVGQYLVERDLDLAIAPELDEFDKSQARQQALLARLSIASPAAVVFEGMTALAGTGIRRHRQFVAQTVAYHQAWTSFFYPLIDSRTALKVDDYAHIPSFVWHDEPASQLYRQSVIGILELLVPALLLLGVAGWRFRRLSVN